MIDKAKEIFEWARKVQFVPDEADYGIIKTNMEVYAGKWGHPSRNKSGYFNEENPQPGYWSRLFLEKDRTFRYFVGFKYMSPLEVITISNPEELS